MYVYLQFSIWQNRVAFSFKIFYFFENDQNREQNRQININSDEIYKGFFKKLFFYKIKYNEN